MAFMRNILFQCQNPDLGYQLKVWILQKSLLEIHNNNVIHTQKSNLCQNL